MNDRGVLTFGVNALNKDEALAGAYRWMRQHYPSLVGKSSWTFRRTGTGRFQVTVSYRRTMNHRDGE